MAETQNLSDRDESSDSSDSENKDVRVQVQDPILTARNMLVQVLVFQQMLTLHVRKNFLPTKESTSKEGIKQLPIQLPGIV